MPDGRRVGGLVPAPLICGRPASSYEGRHRVRERVAERSGRGGGLAQHGAAGVGVDGVEEEGELDAVRGAQVCRVLGRGVVELVDVGGVAGRGVVIADGEGPRRGK